MFNGAVRIHDRTPTDGRPTVNDRTIHHHGALATRYSLVDDCIRRDDQGKGQGERMQSRPEFVPRLAQTNLAQGEHGVKFFPPDGKCNQLTVRSEIRSSCHRAIILQVGITENAVALQLPKNADHDLCVAAAADYNDYIHALPGLQKNPRDSGWLAIHVPLQKGWQPG